MRRVIRSVWFATGLAALGAMMAGGPEAQAGGVVVVTGGITQGSGSGGDPTYTYTFDLYLTGGSISPDGAAMTSTFTVNDLIGVSGLDFTGYIGTPSAPSQPPTTATPGSPQAMETWTVPSGGVVTTELSPGPGYTPNGYNYEGTVTWDYVAGPTINYSGTQIFLGAFTVNTSWNYGASQPPPMGGGSTVIYDYNIGGTTGSGSLILAGVPEPSSFVLLLIGGAALPMAAAYRRRRPASRRAG